MIRASLAIACSLMALPLQAQAFTEAEATKLAEEAYIYGYPLLTMEYTRRVMTNTDVPKHSHAPMGQFHLSKTYPNAQFRDVTAPNADTLYSTAWLDLSKEPMVLSLPDMGDRYFLMPMLSGWTDVFVSPGKRTTGGKAQTYAITGPGWKGTLPAGVKELKSPTNMTWILGRTYCTGTAEDYKACHTIMDQYKLVPLSAWGQAYTPPVGKVNPAIDMKTPVRERVNKLDAGVYFKLLAALMKDSPPSAADAPMVAKLAKLGIEAGKEFDIAKADPIVAKALAAASKPAITKIAEYFKVASTMQNGWMFSTKLGEYGTDYLLRATVTFFGLGANLSKDAIYPTSEFSAEHQKYNGANKYTIHFEKGQTPPVDAFWSITMYDANYFFVDNPLNKYNVSPRNDLKFNADGSLDLLIQNESPGKEKEANWLPAPKGDFVLMMRLYWPKEKDPSIIDGSWKIPAVTVVK